MEPTDEIRQVAAILAEKFRPQKIILFGSRAYGTPRPDSDTDILVILPFSGSTHRMTANMLGAIRPRFGYHLVPRTPDAVKMWYESGDPMMREAIDLGILLYEAAA